jgi:streptogramin lyase
MKWPPVLAAPVLILGVTTITSPAAASSYTVTDYALTGGMANPYGMTLGPDGNLWFSECHTTSCSGSGIGSVTPSGSIASYPVTGVPGFGTESLTTGPDGAIWFTQAGSNGYIGRITTSGAVSYPSPAISYPGDITTGPDGNLWFTTDPDPRGSPGSVGRLTTSGAMTTYTNAGIDNPNGIVTGPDGNLWFTNRGNNTIGRITPSGSLATFGDPSINEPLDITVGSDGALWFTNAGNNSIGRITTGGVISNFTGNGIDQPRGITSAGGSLWFTNYGNNSLGQITTSGIVSWFPDSGINTPGNVAADQSGAIWFTNLNGASVGKLVNPSTGAITITNPGAQSTYQFSRLDLQVNGSSSDDPLTWSAAGAPASLTIGSSTGIISGLVTAAPGTYPVTVSASDQAGDGAGVQFSWTVKADVGSNVKNRSSGKCLNNSGGWITSGNPILIWTCFASGPNDMFSHPSNPGELIVLGQCLTNPGSGDAGTKQVIEPCTGASDQIWDHNTNSEYVQNILCLTDPSGSTTNGTPVQVRTCKNYKDQHWQGS